MDTFEKVKKYCISRELLCHGERILVGVSGGADSVCLLRMLIKLQKELALTLFPVHINHMIREGAADEDEEFTKQLCKAYRLELLVRRIDVPMLAKEQGISLEEAGRNARYACFHELSKQYGCDKTAVAHHMDDQAETVLFHLFRGSRMRGLAGMEPKSGDIIRPLLCVSKKEILAYLEKINQNYRIDATNADVEYTRNRIRKELIPAAERVHSGAARQIAETAEYFRRANALIARMEETVFETAVTYNAAEKRYQAEVAKLSEVDEMIAEGVLYRALCLLAGVKRDITAAHVRACMSLLRLQPGRKVSLPYGIVVTRNYKTLDMMLAETEGAQEEKQEEAPVMIMQFPMEWIFSDGGKISLSLHAYEKNQEIPKNDYTKWFDFDKIALPLCLRTKKEQDEIVLYSDGRKKDLTSFFASCKIPKQNRDKIHVLAQENRILWVIGVRQGEGCRIEETTKTVLAAEYTPPQEG